MTPNEELAAIRSAVGATESETTIEAVRRRLGLPHGNPWPQPVGTSGSQTPVAPCRCAQCDPTSAVMGEGRATTVSFSAYDPTIPQGRRTTR